MRYTVGVGWLPDRINNDMQCRFRVDIGEDDVSLLPSVPKDGRSRSEMDVEFPVTDT